jgi:hypothetical protein
MTTMQTKRQTTWLVGLQAVCGNAVCCKDEREAFQYWRSVAEQASEFMNREDEQ